MRDIKFRAKATNDGPLHDKGDWLYGFYTQMQGPVKTIHFIQSGYADTGRPDFLERNRIDPTTLGQFTGRKDNNGKEIYESDMVQWDEMNSDMLVSFWHAKWVTVHHPTCGAEVEGECAYDDLSDFGIEELEVVGNASDNPELLRVPV